MPRPNRMHMLWHHSFTFDNAGRLTGTTTSYSFLARNFTTSYTYDKASNRTGFTDPESGSTTYAYDTLNRLQTLTPPTAYGTGSFGFSYDALSRRTQMTRPNNVSTLYAYDNLSRLQSVLHQLSGSTIDGATYTADNAGNRTAKTDQRTAVTTNYSYDNIYELLSAAQGGATTESYTYDPVGNRLTSLGVANYTNNTSNELTSTSNATYTYDYNGNLTSKTDSTGTTNYTWDFENRLTSVTLPGTGGTVSFKYDPFGRRIYKSSSSGTSIYAYDGDNLVEETNSSGTAVARYSQGLSIDEPLAMLRSGTTSYYQTDGLGSVTSLSNTAGALAQSYTRDSFGEQTASSGSLTNPFQYTGREFDTETSLYYYRARYYDPRVGRFTSEDFLRIPDGLSRYGYALNSAVNYLDPLGLCPWEIRTRPLKLPKSLNDPAKRVTPSDNPPTHNYFHNTVTGQTVGFGPLHDTLGNAIFGPGAWLPPEQPGKTKDDKPLGAVPDDICDCVDKKLKNPGAPPNYCLTGPNILHLPCTNCWNWDLKIITDCKNEKAKSK